MVAGPYGIGKTLLYLRLLNILAKYKYTYIDIAPPALSYADIIKSILSKLELRIQSDNEKVLQNQLFHHLSYNIFHKSYLLITIDDIQDFPTSTLNKLRLLSNYNIQGFYPFQFIFFAHSSFLKTLSAPELGSLYQRIRRRYHIYPFDFHETKEYIYFMLLNSGASGSPFFPDEIIELIHQKSGGDSSNHQQHLR